MRGHVPHTEDEIRAMLGAVGVGAVADLFASVPEACRLRGELDLAPGLSEHEVARTLRALADRNAPAGMGLSFLGGGVYDRITPAVVGAVLCRPEFYSAYTPYQPEVSQGTLQVIFEFQTLMARLTGMDAANASLYDGASALAEALLLAGSATRRNKLVLPASLQPAARRVIETYTAGQGYELITVPWNARGEVDAAALADAVDGDTAAVAVQSPNHFGVVEDLAALAPVAKATGALLCVHGELTSLALVEAPGRLGADVVTAEGQTLGLPMSFGGPLLGVIGVNQAHLRRLPGRLAGATADAKGRAGYVLTLQTREQHIRREKATSNICTNQGLMALAATVYLAALGEAGLAELAGGLASRAAYLADRIAALPGYRLPFAGDIYQEFVVQAPVPAADLLATGRERGLHAGLPLGDDFPALGDRSLLVCVSEKHTKADLDRFADFLGSVAP
ncbi:MAG: aminomethyl-transferring glycine dehydrogenase subunit GcvPA [Candidatus Krumholzibacteriota bacterium]|nr:aminomethyl-transferring glycine dehydrogenase subunit GcvPA [Candidatus Krumholzibacteriota bacterium]